jgi:hypothetical protein
MATLRSWYERGRGAFLARLVATGAVAGLAAWVFAYALHHLLGLSAPTLFALLLAIPRGALVGLVLGLVLSLYWGWREPAARHTRLRRDEDAGL